MFICLSCSSSNAAGVNINQGKTASRNVDNMASLTKLAGDKFCKEENTKRQTKRKRQTDRQAPKHTSAYTRLCMFTPGFVYGEHEGR